MTPTRSDLLHNVASAIIASGYAAPVRPKRPYVRRSGQIAELARERWVECGPRSTARAALLDDVMNRYGVSRNNARRLVQLARKMREENSSHVD